MKKDALPSLIIISCLVVICLSACQPLATPSPPKSVKLNLKIPSGLYYQRTPEAVKSVSFNADFLLSSVNVFTSDNDSSFVLNQGQSKKFPHGKQSFLMAIPILHNLEITSDSANIYSFGEFGGEDSIDAAAVTVRYGNDQASNPPGASHHPVMIELEADQIWIQKSPSDTAGFSKTKYLKIPANNNKKATISITQESRRGRVMVCIIRISNEKLLALLNPKVNQTQSFTTDKDVYVIPLIVPNISGSFGFPTDTVIFAVGDPVVNGTVKAEEN